MTHTESPDISGTDVIRGALPAFLILLLAAFPPHVYPEVLAPALALAALAGLVAPRARRLGLLASAACIAAIFLNVATSLQALQSLRTIAMAAAMILTGLCCAGLASRRSGRWAQVVMGAVALAGTGLALHGLYQALFVFGPAVGAGAVGEAIPEAVRARIASGRAVGTLGLPAALGGFLAMSIPVTGMWVRRKNAPVSARVCAAILVAIQGAGLIATRSASALCALGVAGALVVWGLARDSRGARRRTLAISAWAIAAAALAGAALFLVLRLAGPAAADEGSGPLMLRALNWKVALEIAAASPMLGAGAGCYGIAFPALREWGMNESRFAHNSYLQILAEGGLVLGVPALIALGLLARRAWRAAGAGSDATLLSLACLAFMAHNVVDFTLFLPTTGMVFACLAGLLVGAGRQPGAGAIVRPAALVALALSVMAAIVGTGDRARDAARDLMIERRLEEAGPLARRAVRLNPIDPEARSLLSQILLETAAARRDPAGLREAERLAHRAVRLDPRTPGRWRHLGRARLARGDLVGAYLALARAAALYPIRIEYREERDALRERIARAANPG